MMHFRFSAPFVVASQRSPQALHRLSLSVHAVATRATIATKTALAVPFAAFRFELFFMGALP
jgi:hypothetical protein